MFPGLSPIYLNPQSLQTNVAPRGNDPGWSLAQSPNVVIPNLTTMTAEVEAGGAFKGAHPPRQENPPVTEEKHKNKKKTPWYEK